jgi:hypothetical protein
MTMAAKSKPSLKERVGLLLAEYVALGRRADALIDEYVSSVARQSPGVPRDVVRIIELGASAHLAQHGTLARMKERL